MKRQSGQSIKLLMKLLRQQDNMCYYCCQPFNKKAIYKRKVIILHPVLDHVIPFSYCQHSKHYNFVVTCQICNAWKSNLIFNTFADAAEYLRNKWLGVRQCKKSVKHVNELSKSENLGSNSAALNAEMIGTPDTKLLPAPIVEKLSLLEILLGVPIYQLSDKRLKEIAEKGLKVK